jgi:hypothetical protein
MHFHDAIARPNLLVKIPATDAGVPAIEGSADAVARSVKVYDARRFTSSVARSDFGPPRLRRRQRARSGS